MGRNALYGASSGGASSGGPTPRSGMHVMISEVNGAHTADDPMYMSINEVDGIYMEEIQCHNTDTETTPHVYDYIPLDSARNTTQSPATTDIPLTGTPASGFITPSSIAEI